MKTLSTTMSRIAAVSCAVVFYALSLTALGLPAVAQENQKIAVATVNGETIYLDEVMRLTEQLPEQFRQQPLQSYFDRLVDDIIDSRLAAAAGSADGLTDDPEVIRQMSIAAQRVLAEAWLNRQIRDIVTQETIQAAYDRYIADEAAREQISARHILVAEKSEAEEIITALKGGADFAELAKEKSTGPSGPKGGDLGYFDRGAMVPSFEAAAFSLEKGAFSQTPVQTQFGWHVIKVEDKRIAAPPRFEELAPQLRQTLISQNLGLLLDSLRNDAALTRRSFEDIRKDAQGAAQQ